MQATSFSENYKIGNTLVKIKIEIVGVRAEESRMACHFHKENDYSSNQSLILPI